VDARPDRRRPNAATKRRRKVARAAVVSRVKAVEVTTIGISRIDLIALAYVITGVLIERPFLS
jgi:hypothetical protein